MMDNEKCTKTYERISNNFKYKAFKRLSNLFDKVAEGSGKDGINNRTLIKKKSHIGAVDRKIDRFLETPNLEKSTKGQPLYHLFESSSEVEKPQKKTKRYRSTQQKSRRNKPRRSTFYYADLKYSGMHSSASTIVSKSDIKNVKNESASMPVSTSVMYPSIELFRDLKKQSVDWSFVGSGKKSSFEEISLSKSNSDHEEMVESMSDTSTEERQRIFTFTEPWTPTGIKKRSFVKIRTPASGECPQIEKSHYSSDKIEGPTKANSYTSLYSWKTATGTTASATQTSCQQKPMRMEYDAEISSPTLLLKTCQQNNLHSTAIDYQHDNQHLQKTPQISPIRPLPDEEGRQLTPSAPTHNVSPRGPRKSHSFSSMRTRTVPPKCSTMLFSPSIADAGDAPLDVSSIRKALPETMHLTESAANSAKGKQRGNKVVSQGVNSVRILTSTPLGGGSNKLMWNLSSVQSPSEEEELVPLRTSGTIINSQEIMAMTSSDASVNMSGDLVLEPEEMRQKENEDARIACSYSNKPESGVIMENSSGSSPGVANKGSSKAAGRNDEDKEVHDEHLDLDVESGQELPESKGVKNARQSSSDSEYVERFDTSDSSFNYQLSINDHLNIYSPNKKEMKQNRLKRRLLDGYEEGENICLLSALKKTPCPRPGGHKPSLLLWVEPSDSGFLEMIDQAPKDIICLTSKK